MSHSNRENVIVAEKSRTGCQDETAVALMSHSNREGVIVAENSRTGRQDETLPQLQFAVAVRICQWPQYHAPVVMMS